LVTSRAFAEAIWAAGGEPVTLLPVAGSDWQSRLEGISGVLLVGGGDINPSRYGQPADASVYDVDDLQDEADLSLAKYALENSIPLLGVCRGLQIVNVLRGGTLVQDMPNNHRHKVHEVKLEQAGIFGQENSAVVLTSSCYHHQCVDQLGQGIEVVARAEDETVEAIVIAAPGYACAVQWHPEDTASSDPAQLAIFTELVAQARLFLAN
jgi:putative glutamine amidotransferase